ncbi:MAG: hypothetical protein PHE53_08000 [Thermoguttaceae bacterium]|nr:hypothetical protein [Thermoguttaceae bacterium]
MRRWTLSFLYRLILGIFLAGIVLWFPNVSKEIAAATVPLAENVSTEAALTDAVPTKLVVELNGQPTLPSPGSVTGTWFFCPSDGHGPQMLLLGFPETGPKKTPSYRLIAELQKNDTLTLWIPTTPSNVVWIPLDTNEQGYTLETTAVGSRTKQTVTAKDDSVVLRLATRANLDPVRRPVTLEPMPSSPSLRAAIAEALIEWDWRMADGIEVPRETRSYRDAMVKILAEGDALLQDLKDLPTTAAFQTKWNALRQQCQSLANTAVITGNGESRSEALSADASQREWESLWLKLHQLRRKLVLSNPLFSQVGPLLFTKHVPSVMSHQLTQCYGYTARPGGGLFLLPKPGESMETRNITPSELPAGSFMQTDLSPEEGADRKVVFAFVAADESPSSWRTPESVMSRYYHIYEMNADGSGLRQLTDGEFNDFAPVYTPGDKLTFISTRRGGYHRCGGGPCFVYTLAQMNRDGSEVTVKSFHETNEWDPTVLDNGRLVYTRWDYVDRNAVYYQNLWSTRLDGTDTRIFFGNNTFNPAGIWQSQPVPGSSKVMAIAGPHHAMSAGSVILIDTSRGVDGPEPLERLTPDALFPEAEVPLAGTAMPPAVTEFDTEPPSWWDGRNPPSAAEHAAFMPEEQTRWPGHCYVTPYPLSEKYFIVSYSYDRLRGEAGPNIPNMFGLYFADRFGNRELIYRDPMITSQWAKPLQRPRREIFDHPPQAQVDAKLAQANHGTLFMQNVYESWPKLPAGERITRLRIIQVLPKTTPNANQPMVGVANASPGKQVLGTVPVEADGSAYFELPAGTPISFVALNEKGRAVQIMRSVHYLQPGETGSCIGCHEKRSAAPPMIAASGLAGSRAPSVIESGPDGSKPLSYPILVQPVLDAHCVKCHSETPSDAKGNGGVILTGEPEGTYTKSYMALVGKTAYTAWGMADGNGEPLSVPGRFASGGSELTRMLDAGHYDVQLSEAEWERLCTWMDANSLFYGTFNPEEQAKQQRGERIEGPDLE